MFFGIDLDQTVSTGHMGVSVQESIEHYQHKGINVPETITTSFELFQLPEVLRIHEVLSGAVEGTKYLVD